MTTTTTPITRTGKIARLPRQIRDQLNHRLADGEPGNKLLDWLNQQPLVQETLARLFEGRAITAQNLSEWKKGGWQDWLRHQENLTSASLALEEAQDLEAECGQGHGLPLSDRLSSLAALALAKVIRSANPDSPESHRALLAAIQTLNTLRYADHQAARLKITLERHEEEKAERAKAQAAASEHMSLVQIMREITGVDKPRPSPPPAPEAPSPCSKAVPALSPSEPLSSLPPAPFVPADSRSIQVNPTISTESSLSAPPLSCASALQPSPATPSPGSFQPIPSESR